MRNYIPIVQLEARDPAWAARVRERDKNKRRRQRARYRNQDLAKYLWLGVRLEAKRKGVDFDLTVEWFRLRLKTGVCEMSALPFDLESQRGPNRPSVDRKAAGGHYTQANCRLVLYSINMALSNYGEDYVLNVFRHVLARRGG
jgi:hypothetical protein